MQVPKASATGTRHPVTSGVRDERPDRCPQCGSQKIAEILYGFLDVSAPEVRDDLDQGRAILGGCCPDAESKDWSCHACGHKWGDLLTKRMQEFVRSYEEKDALEDDLAAQRGILEAIVRPDGWVTCPYCSRNFATYSKMSWDGEKHQSCRTRLRLVSPA
jgi:DNA-directed RNA polymerase subunit RPC12/RpoP